MLKSKPGLTSGEKLFWGAFFLLTLFRAYYATAIPLTGDEAYHWEWSRHLAWGYYDHPPLVAWLIACFTGIGGATLFWTRLTALLCISGTTYLTFRLGKEIGGPAVGTSAGLLSLAATAMTLGAVIVTTDSPLIFCWMLTVFLVWRALQTGRGWYWYLAGAALGLGMLAKFLIFPLLPAIFLLLVFSPVDRTWLRRPEPYLGLALAFLIFSPFLIWNSQHGWASFAFHLKRHPIALDPARTLEFLKLQLLLISPLLYGAMLWSAVRLGRAVCRPGVAAAEQRINLLLLLGGWLLPGLLFLDSIRNLTSGHWPMAAYGTALVGLALVMTWRQTQKQSMGRRRSMLLPLLLVTALLWTGAAVTLTLNPTLIEKLTLRGHQVNEAYGWEEIGRAVSKLHQELAPANPGLILATSSYTDSSMLSFYTPDQLYLSVLGPGSKHGRAYDLWDQWPDWTGRAVLFISTADPRQPDSKAGRILTASLSSWRVVRVVSIRRHGQIVRSFYCSLGRGLRPDPYAAVRQQYRW